MNGSDSNEYVIRMIDSEEDAIEASKFLYSEFSFDDRNFTQGELEHMKTCTLESLKQDDFYYWCAKDKQGKIIGIVGVKQNEQKSGGYLGDYCVVHRDYRNKGIALEMHDVMFAFLKSINARYMLVETCDTASYAAIRKLFGIMGFEKVGHVPDYYFENEGLLLYLKKFKQDNSQT